MELAIPRSKYDSPAKIRQFYQELRDRLAALPGVQQATAVYPLPMSGRSWSGSFEIEGRPPVPGEPEPHAEYAAVMPGYFRALRIPLKEGRELTEQDTEGAPEVVIVDELLARRYFPGESAVGKRLDVGTIVGVVAHVRNAGPHEEGEPQIYKPFLQWPQAPMFAVVRAAGDPAALAPALRRAVRAVDADQPVTALHSMPDLVHGAVARQRFNMLFLSLFAAVALVLAIVGLYGVMAGLVSQRVHEIGIRLALGGRPGHALRLILGEGMTVVLAGLLIGLAAAVALSRAVAGLLFSTATTDPLTYGAIAALVLLVSLAATWVPARRATRIDPLVALRDN
jgi:predicted permease